MAGFLLVDNVLEEFRLSTKARGIRLTTPDAEAQDSKKVTQHIFGRLSRNSTPAIQEIVVDLSNREKETRKKSFEDAAKDFLMDLIDRSLVIISRRRSNSRVRAFRLRDLILNFFGGYLKSTLQSIASLRKLETLIVKGLIRKIILPNTIWRITSLRYLHVTLHVSFNSDDEQFGDCFVLENLGSFSSPSLSCGEDAERIIEKLPNLCKLSCIFYDSSSNCNQFPRLNFLTHLESLKIFCYGNLLTMASSISH
ncbi:uncharacterized protein [Coffea arabica]|uniref:Uncharacterized protein isoform X2 n=1 Tax=Coffea arabica TaxID=13443 RepID=A0A6P6WQI8_COFAR|nr:uncharacterized protein LOC113735000 isoform X2 [Coffea arabica]